MQTITLTVTGMSCQHCEKAVINALEDIGVTSVTASAKNNSVEITFDSNKISLESIKNEISDVGYAIA